MDAEHLVPRQEQQMDDQEASVDPSNAPVEEVPGLQDYESDDINPAKRQKTEESSGACKFFEKGMCKFGDKCRLTHSTVLALQNTAAPPTTPGPVCKFWREGTCKFGSKCRSSHGVPGGPSKVPGSTSIQGSPFQNVSPYAFIPISRLPRTSSQVVIQSNNNKKAATRQGELCVFFSKGACNFGDKCRGLHDPSTATAPAPTISTSSSSESTLESSGAASESAFESGLESSAAVLDIPALESPVAVSEVLALESPVAGSKSVPSSPITSTQNSHDESLPQSEAQSIAAKEGEQHENPTSVPSQNESTNKEGGESSGSGEKGKDGESKKRASASSDVCVFFRRGVCKFGTRCRSRHIGTPISLPSSSPSVRRHSIPQAISGLVTMGIMNSGMIPGMITGMNQTAATGTGGGIGSRLRLAGQSIPTSTNRASGKVITASRQEIPMTFSWGSGRVSSSPSTSAPKTNSQVNVNLGWNVREDPTSVGGFNYGYSAPGTVTNTTNVGLVSTQLGITNMNNMSNMMGMGLNTTSSNPYEQLGMSLTQNYNQDSSNLQQQQSYADQYEYQRLQIQQLQLQLQQQQQQQQDLVSSYYPSAYDVYPQ